ncbi:AI-2E family transporter [Mycolicibacterium rhodesiae]|uniref:AI-2E family transporter n=1 Tax=Mycolicibacterium rhodesiae TaxID=36814 RepID=A0A1X0IPC0_MYCRH|nr:AI-2E family transporter [Mycolicibacterium rhodesiae]MCV7344249.1 AI-2E family transporter [Mycolicibacterium rhodesiae]ORB50119.1 AI-2E family transporter [Mycolicibacterium rhodesiae]
MNTEFTVTQKRALAIVTLVAVLLGAYFLRHYFILVVIAAIVAYLFTPLYNRCRRRFGTGLSATMTVLAALATVIIPVGALLTLAVLQVSHMVVHVAEWVQNADMSTVGDQALDYANHALAKLPFGHFSVTADSVRESLVNISQNLGRWLLHALQGAAGGAIGVITSAIIFLYVLVSLLTNQEQLLTLIRRLNPLGEEVTDLYLAKMGAMVKGTVKGQFIIALVQGLLGAASIYIGGFHNGFFIFAIFLTALSVIPLGSGIITIPFGIGMMFFGNIGGGLFVVLFHIIGVTNVDNFLRPILVPREARLDPALMLLAVFSGIAMFGFWGIVLGPVLMIIIVTTISVYLAVYKGVEMTSHEPPEKRRRLFRRRITAETEATAAAADGEPQGQ